MDGNDIKLGAKVTDDTAHQNVNEVVSVIISELIDSAITYHKIISTIDSIRSLSPKMILKLANRICEYQDPRSVVNYQSSEGLTVLHCLVMLSAKMNNDNYIERLLDCDGINVNLTYKNKSALMIAARNCDSDIVRMLLKKGADVNIKNNYNDTALTKALKHRNTKIVELLLTYDYTEAPHIYNQVLHEVYTENSMILFDLLTEKNRINPNLQDNEGNTVLMEFAKLCDSDDVGKLLDQKDVNVNISNNDGNTALMIAASLGSAEVLCKLLAIEQIGINMTNKNGVSALMCAARRSRQEYIISRYEGLVTHYDQNEACLRLLLDHPEIKCSFKDIISVFLSCDLGVISTFIGNRFHSMCDWFGQMMQPIVAFAKSAFDFCMRTINPVYQWLAQKVKSICHWRLDSDASTSTSVESSSKLSHGTTISRELDASKNEGSKDEIGAKP